MDRRDFLRLLLNLPASSTELKPTSLPPDGTIRCAICGSRAVIFDRMLDVNLCLKCGAHETAKGWRGR